MRKRLLILPLVLLAGTASVAGAQVLNAQHDQGPPAGQIKRVTCGPLQESVVSTNSAQVTTSSVPWVPSPATQTQITLPPGPERCVKVLLTAETSCTGWDNGPDYCYVQALVDGVPMDPNGADFQAIDSEDATADGHAYEWVAKVGPGNHLVELQRRVGNPNTVFTHDELTFDVQLFQ